ncbi:MAG: hypothetical protein QOK35_282, partial [Pseudonocardiales bacterium]|nr:hypothetical protein [Pseudonocardiales bacterium]
RVVVTREGNADVVARSRNPAQRRGYLARVTAERHGAIRVGTPGELARAGRIFAAFGMAPVGFYDLRDAGPGAVPVVSTAFRPVERAELARNPFRVFTSMLVADDPRYFDAATTARLQTVLGERVLFSPELLALADRAAAEGGLPSPQADELLERATAAFALSRAPVDRRWYAHLDAISAVAADIGGVASTHLNHLTPRVLDIDDLQARMRARGIEMIDEIQGPPGWEGPDLLLRQTSFRALAEDRVFAEADGSVTTGALRVRFGEVEQRGIAPTPRGRALYDRMVAEVDGLVAEGADRTDAGRDVWRRSLPRTERELAREGLGFFTYRVAPGAAGARKATFTAPGAMKVAFLAAPELVDAGVLVAEPIVYEDFLPRSAAGIFRSNLAGDSTRDADRREEGPPYDLGRLSDLLGMPVRDPMDLYAAEAAASLQDAAAVLGAPITTPAEEPS